MTLHAFDHVNIRTTSLAAMQRFYEEVLGLVAGDRPDFEFPGAWLYLGDTAVVHLVGIPDEPPAAHPKIEHAAFRASGLGDFLAHLRAHKTAYRIGVVPSLGIRQVNVHDPDGNHLHIDFGPEEEADLSPYDGD
ncbi:MAG: VOC family protein [Azospirillaceae bacterium]